LSAAGAAVVVNYSFSKEGADRVVADIKANGGKAIAVKGDVAKAADVRRLFAETIKTFHTLDVLVNNAGVYKFLPLEEITEDEFHREFNINVLGVASNSSVIGASALVDYIRPRPSNSVTRAIGTSGHSQIL
jgi:3-oxoacyl-[acyl-carrier protein] reductase